MTRLLRWWRCGSAGRTHGAGECPRFGQSGCWRAGTGERVRLADAIPPHFETEPSWPNPLPAGKSFPELSPIAYGRPSVSVATDSRDNVSDPSGAESGLAEGGSGGDGVPACVCLRHGWESPAAGLRRAWQGLPVDGGPEPSSDVASRDARRARNVRRSQGQRLGDRQRPRGAQVLSGREVPVADRRVREDRREQRTKLLGNPTGLAVEPATNEVYVADG